MWRALVFIGLLALAAFGAVWLADRPGNVVVNWGGYQAQTSVAVAAVLTIGIAIALAFLWAVVTFVLSVPNRMSYASRARRRAKGYAAVSRGMVAVGAGDPGAARRHAGEAERLLGREPLTLLLKAQAAQIAGDRSGAEAAFRGMAEDAETRVLGLRGLFVEARRRGDAVAARAYAGEAARLAPALVPAAAVAGQVLSRRAELRKAAKIVEAAWKTQPHPDLADVYMNLRPGDSALDRLHRAETLAKLSSWHRESRLALARAALEAREFGRAREVLRPLLSDRPTVRACLLMADIEQAEHGVTGQVREWLARASRSPRDPVWIADGVVSDRWGPVSPVTGRLDVFVWEAPPDVLAGPGASIDDVVADLDDKPRIAIPAPAAPQVEESPPAAAPAMVAVAEDAAPARAEPAREGNGAGNALEPGPREEDHAVAPVVFPVAHAPDDPGPGSDAEKPARRRLFG